MQQSLDAGYEVTIHQSPITESGWTGAGYTAIDPATGAGAYTIEGGGNGGWLELANVYLALYGAGAWDEIRKDRTAIQQVSGQLNPTYREAEHFLYALQHSTPENGWFVSVMLTEGYWVIKALSNAILQSNSPWSGSPVSFDQLIAGLYGSYCYTFGCAGIE